MSRLALIKRQVHTCRIEWRSFHKNAHPYRSRRDLATEKMISFIQGTISNANRTEYSVGPVAGEAPNTNWNAGVASLGYQADELSRNLNEGVNTSNKQAAPLTQNSNESLNTSNHDA